MNKKKKTIFTLGMLIFVLLAIADINPIYDAFRDFAIGIVSGFTETAINLGIIVL
ncbi:hypothetical protein [Clostridium oceanicum]|uniref:Uncharacterized protein n=1 Tax=Clostridium oceanicum TaxID=1543 RepID=A0ABN1JQ23_9CLOT